MRLNKSWFESPSPVAPQLGPPLPSLRPNPQPALNFFDDEEEPHTPCHEQHYKVLQPPSTTATKQPSVIESEVGRPVDTGLRRLAGRVLNIVKQQPHTTLQNVTGIILGELKRSTFILPESNQETNIKRRIYDSLNVLLSIQVIRKEKNRIIYCPPPPSEEQSRSEAEWVRLQNMVQLRKLRMRELATQIREAKQKEKGIRRLLGRNRRGTDQRQGKVRFPLVGMELRLGWQVVRCEREVVDLFLKQSKLLNTFGDLDCLRWLRQI